MAIDPQGNIIDAEEDPITDMYEERDQEATTDKAFQKNYNEKVASIKKKLAKKGQVVYGEVSKQRFRPEKNRDDYRHNQIDAVVVALSNHYNQYFNTLSTQGGQYQALKQIEIPSPYQGFREDLKDHLSQTLVSFRQTNRHFQRKTWYLPNGRKVYHDVVRGPLHKDTIYGKRKNDADNVFHIREKIDNIKGAKLNKIAESSPYLEKIIKTWHASKKEERTLYPEISIKKVRIHDKKVGKDTVIKVEDLTRKQMDLIEDPTLKATIKAWYKAPSSSRALYPTQPIKKMRIKHNKNRMLAVDKDHGQWVDPQNNYITGIYEDSKGKWSDACISLFETVKRKKQGLPILPSHDEKGNLLLFTIRRLDYFVLGLTREQIDTIDWRNPSKEHMKLIHSHLHRVQKMSKGEYVFSKQQYIGGLFTITKGASKLKTYNPVKVKIDRLGNIKDHQII